MNTSAKKTPAQSGRHPSGNVPKMAIRTSGDGARLRAAVKFAGKKTGLQENSNKSAAFYSPETLYWQRVHIKICDSFPRRDIQKKPEDFRSFNLRLRHSSEKLPPARNPGQDSGTTQMGSSLRGSILESGKGPDRLTVSIPFGGPPDATAVFLPEVGDSFPQFGKPQTPAG